MKHTIRVRRDRIANLERHAEILPLGWKRGLPGAPPAVIHLTGHGSGFEQGVAAGYCERPLLALADAGFPVMTIDGGSENGQTWASDAAMAAITAAVAFARSPTGLGASTGKVVLSGLSLGGVEALAWTVLNPAQVLGVACMIPATDLIRHHGQNVPNYAKAEIEAAYGTGVVASVAGVAAVTARNPRSNPGAFAGIPIKVWHGPADTAIPTAWTTDFINAVPSAEGRALAAGVGHDPTTIDPAEYVAFVEGLT